MIGDKARDSDGLAAELVVEGVELSAPHRNNRKPQNQAQNGRKLLRRYSRRPTVESTIRQIENAHRLCNRWKKSTLLFHGLLRLGGSIVLLNGALGAVA